MIKRLYISILLIIESPILPYLQGVTDPNLAYHSQINVTKIGDQLKASLEDRGIGTSIDKTDIMGTSENG